MQVKLYSIVLSVSVLLFACGGEEVNEEVVDFEDFAGQTGTDDKDSSKTEDLVKKIDNSQLGIVINKLITNYDTSAHDEFSTIDRFGFNEQRKVRFTGKETVPYGSDIQVNPVADFFYYSFEDSIKTKNAFYNYLDGLSNEGEGGPVKLNEDVESIKMPPLFMAVYDTIIISAAYKCEHEANNWQAFEDAIFNVFGKKYRYYIDVECGGPLRWK